MNRQVLDLLAAHYGYASYGAIHDAELAGSILALARNLEDVLTVHIEGLVNEQGLSEMMNVSVTSGRTVRARWGDFPEPVVNGRLWDRAEIEIYLLARVDSRIGTRGRPLRPKIGTADAQMGKSEPAPGRTSTKDA